MEEIEIKIEYKESLAEWQESNNQKYILIVAKNHYEFGLLRGQILKKEIKVTNRILNSFMKVFNISIDQILTYARKYTIPQNYMEEIQGLSDGTGLTEDRILLQKCWIDIYYGILQPSGIVKENVGACTSFIVKNKKNHYVHGQTMDFGLVFFPSFNWIKYKIFGKEPVFCINLGCSTFPMGKNPYITSTINLVQTRVKGEFGVPTSIKSQNMFETCRSSIDFYKYMTQSCCAGWNYISLDKSGNVIACETLPHIRANHHLNGYGYIVKTNTFQIQELKSYLLDILYSIKRQEKMEELIKKKLIQKKKFEISDGMEIFCYNDGTEASICRISHPNNYLDVVTEGFFITNGNKTFYGIGNPIKDSWGQVQI